MPSVLFIFDLKANALNKCVIEKYIKVMFLLNEETIIDDPTVLT